MKSFFPVFLNLEGKNVLVVGAGAVARQKIKSLVEAQAKVRVVSKDLSALSRGERSQKNVKFVKRAFRASDIKTQDLVFCATDDEVLNARVGQLCRAKRIWVNVADRPPLCSFIMPSIFRRGQITAAISTGGASPAVAKFMRERLEKYLGPELDDLISILKAARGKLMKLTMEQRQSFLKRIVTEKSFSLIAKGQAGAVRKNLDRELKKEIKWKL